MADDMILSSEVLRNLAQVITQYCYMQNEILDNFLTNMQALSSEWQDDETFSSMMEEIQLLTRQSKQYFGELYNTYPALFQKMADQIDARPTFGQTSYSSGYSSGSAGSAGGSGSTGGGAQPPVDPMVKSLFDKYSGLSDQIKEKMLSGGPAKDINQFMVQCWKEYRSNPENCGEFAKTVSLQLMRSYQSTSDDDDTPPVLKLVKKR